MYINNNIIKLPPEIEKGNIEYKRKIHNISKERLFQLTSQLKWRLTEGFDIYGYYCATYIIGIEDDGNISGMKKKDNMETIKNIKLMVTSLNSYINNICNIKHKKGYITEIDIRKNISNYINFNDYKLCLFGQTLSGKSTLLSILLNNIKDNGKGYARNKILKHIHEYENGKTTCLSEHLLYINKNKFVNDFEFKESKNDIIKLCNKIISIIDIPGDKKYFKTTISGILSHVPSFALLLISVDEIKNNKLNNDIINNINILIELKIKFAIVINKIDMENNFNNIIKQFQFNLNKKIKLNTNLISNICKYNYNIINIIPISCIEKYNFSLLENFLINFNKTKKITDNNNTEFMINNVHNLPDIGTIVSGTLLNGTILTNNILKIGPINNYFYDIKIMSIHRKQIPFERLNMYQSASMFIKILNKNKNNDNIIHIKKNMMIVSNSLTSNIFNSFIFITNNKKINTFIKYNSLLIFFNNNKEPIIIQSVIKNDDDYILNIKLSNKNKYCYIINNNDAIIKNNNKIIIGKIFKYI